jgi:hypothetical protein
MTQRSTKQHEMLRLVAEYRSLLASQIAYLNGTGLRAAQKKVTALATNGYLNVASHTLGTKQGRPENIYSLNQRGLALLKRDRGSDVLVSAKWNAEVDNTNIRHELLINWFRLHLLEIERYIPDLRTAFLSATTPFLPLRDSGMPCIADEVSIGGQDEWFVPDGVFSITSRKQKKRLLFFLEADMATEPLRSRQRGKATIAGKVRNYQAYFLSRAYQRYEKQWNDPLNGFRVLFLTNTSKRNEAISRYLHANWSCDFIWVTDAQKMFRHGLSAKIWTRGGQHSRQLESILGSTLSCQRPLPKLS